ncbi:MAG: hypothetical protein RLY31_337 [Bacteroidota bacterium]
MFKSLHLTDRFFLLYLSVAALFALAHPFAALFPVALTFFLAAGIAAGLDAFRLYRFASPVVVRELPSVLSSGDPQQVRLRISLPGRGLFFAEVVEELPVQLQIRDFSREIRMSDGREQILTYDIRPLGRGEYGFGHVILFVRSRIGLLQRRFQAGEPVVVPVYPSVLHMKKMELQALRQTSRHPGLRHMRRIGHSFEFEQIKDYVRGDDYRSLNWKATGRANRLMVNQYEDERSQQVYCIIDKSRVMKTPFDGLTLMEHAINTTLALSNIVLLKYDKAGLVTFSDVLGATVPADRKPRHLTTILQALYNEQERPVEANYELLYQISRRLVNGRSLLILFTQFESVSALERVLPLLRRINRLHLLVVVFFENTEIAAFAGQPADSVEAIHVQTAALRFLDGQQAMTRILRQHGIQSVMTRPEFLSVQTISKYLELKSRGLI